MAGVVLFLGAGTVQDRPEATLAEELRKLIEANLDSTSKEDLEGVMKTIHADSPGRQATERMMKELFQRYDLSYKLISTTLIGADADYAVIRFKQESSKIKGPEFRNNVLDGLHIFRKENESWKLWTTAALEVRYP
jgi:hypothetical protein